MRRVEQLAIGSIVVGIAVLSLKAAAYWITGSIALYSDALESIINVVTAVVALIALRTSAIPADTNHPYGHHKAEYFSAVLEGVLILVAALSILREAYLSLLDLKPLTAPWQGLVVNGAATAINAAWCSVLLRQGRRHRSPALIADGQHLLTDVISSGGVLLGLALVPLTGWTILDPALAALVALNILWSGWQLLSSSVGGLMDVAVPPAERTRIRGLMSAEARAAIEAHALRPRRPGRRTFIEFPLVVPGELS